MLRIAFFMSTLAVLPSLSRQASGIDTAFVSASTGLAFHSSAAARARSQLLGPQRIGDLVALGGGVAVAGLGDEREPFVGLFQVLRHADALGRQDAEVELAVLDAELGRLLEPARGGVVVGRAVGAHREQHGEVVHGAGIALLGGHLVPGLGLGDVALDADALLVEIADAVLRRRQARARPPSRTIWRRSSCPTWCRGLRHSASRSRTSPSGRRLRRLRAAAAGRHRPARPRS